jgi:hypothetical protein
MAKIINFLEEKNRLEMAGLVSALKAKQEREQAQKSGEKPKKRAKAISALPGEAISPEYMDFRPSLQRDGLILLGWGLWANRKGDGLYYRANWIKSRSKHLCYGSGLVRFTGEDEVKTVMPLEKGDINYADEDGWTRYWSKYVYVEIADVVFYAAPALSRHTIPAFIELLKASGVTVDFEYQFSLGAAKELEFKREREEIADRLEKIVKDGGLA